MINLKPASHSHNQNMLFFQGTLNILGGLIGAMAWTPIATTAMMLAVGLSITSGAITIVTTRRRRRPLPDLTASLIFAANLTPAYWLVWLSTVVVARQSGYFVPFEALDLSVLTIAVLAPPDRRIGIPAILAGLVLAVLQSISFTPEQIARMPERSWVAPLAFTMFSIGLYLFRLKTFHISELAARKDVEATLLRRMTRTVLAIKDLANSPIQTIVLDSETLKRKCPEDVGILNRIQHAAHQLRDLNRLLDDLIRKEEISSVSASLDSSRELGADNSDASKHHATT